MATKKPPDPLAERISALPDPPRRAPPPTAMPKWMGKRAIPREEPPLPLAIRTEEKTQTRGMLEPAPGSVGPETKAPETPQPRSLSPAPWERESVVDEVERQAESRGERVVRPRRSPSPPPFDVPRRVEYGIEPATRNWLIALATLLFGTAGTAIYGAVRDPSPPAVQEAPKRVDDQERELRRLRDDVNECRSDFRETEKDVERLLRRTDSIERKYYELEKRTPKITP